jgi:hypothetical protein
MTKNEDIAKALKTRLSELTGRLAEIESELRKRHHRRRRSLVKPNRHFSPVAQRARYLIPVVALFGPDRPV